MAEAKARTRCRRRYAATCRHRAACAAALLACMRIAAIAQRLSFHERRVTMARTQTARSCRCRRSVRRARARGFGVGPARRRCLARERSAAARVPREPLLVRGRQRSGIWVRGGKVEGRAHIAQRRHEGIQIQQDGRGSGPGFLSQVGEWDGHGPRRLLADGRAVGARADAVAVAVTAERGAVVCAVGRAVRFADGGPELRSVVRAVVRTD